MMNTTIDPASALQCHSVSDRAIATRPLTSAAFRRGAWLIALVAVASVTVGCATNKPTQTEATTGPTDAAAQPVEAPAEPPTLAEALKAHASGDVQRGIDLFLAVADADNPAQLILNPMTEAEFAARHIQLPERAAAAMHQRILDEVMAARYLMNDVVKAGDAAMEANRFAEATRHYEAVRDFARANDQPESIKVIQITAEAIEAGAEARLARLDMR